jgi:hypothetical protein
LDEIIDVRAHSGKKSEFLFKCKYFYFWKMYNSVCKGFPVVLKIKYEFLCCFLLKKWNVVYIMVTLYTASIKGYVLVTKGYWIWALFVCILNFIK